jgi:hypothetical protein
MRALGHIDKNDVLDAFLSIGDALKTYIFVFRAFAMEGGKAPDLRLSPLMDFHMASVPE